MHDERKTIRFTAQQMLELQRQSHKNKRSVSDMVRLLTVEAIIERERKILDDLIAEFDCGLLYGQIGFLPSAKKNNAKHGDIVHTKTGKYRAEHS